MTPAGVAHPGGFGPRAAEKQRQDGTMRLSGFLSRATEGASLTHRKMFQSHEGEESGGSGLRAGH